MSEAWGQADLLAYVDDCLPARERAEFEARLASDAALARRAARWRAQNTAIRAAFGGDAAKAEIFDLGRQANENLRGARAGQPPAVRRSPGAAAARSRTTALAPARRRVGVVRALARKLATLAIAAIMVCLALPLGAGASLARLSEAGLDAYRAFATAPAVPMEFATSDALAAKKWLEPRFARGLIVPRLASAGLTLVGARVAPAGGAYGAFLVYETAGRRRVGLLIQPLDSPAPQAPIPFQSSGLSAVAWTGAGHGFILVGDLGGAAMAALVQSIQAAPTI